MKEFNLTYGTGMLIGHLLTSDIWICGEPSTKCSSGQPQCSPHGQRLREHYPRFPCCCILQCWMTAVWDEWWEDWESGTYPIHSGMSRVFYLPQHRTLSTRHPLAFCRMRSTGCWVSADGSQFLKFLGFPPGVWTQASSAASRGSMN